MQTPSRNSRAILTLSGLCLALLALPAAADVKLPSFFSDNMVLQREQPIRVWGSADPKEAVTVTLGAASAKVTADEKGAWKAQLPALKQGENLELTVAGKNTLTLKNLIVGDVWICSGQSNMEFAAGGCNTQEDLNAADLPKIRAIKVAHSPAGSPASDMPTSGWRVCTPQNVRSITAVGFFFGRQIHQEIGVPIGLIDVNWGGTQIEPWVATTGFSLVPELKEFAESIEKTQAAAVADYNKQLPAQLDLLEGWIKQSRTALAENATPPPQPQLLQNPTALPKVHTLFNGMIAPLVQFPIKGALWYQGESNGAEGEIYFQKMQALIGGWRALWGQGNFPFYYVQLASFQMPTDNPAGGDGWAKVRCAQLKALTIPNTGMASALDIGEAGNIHPGNKRDVGARLALWALARDYGKKDLVPSGPLFKSSKVEGSKICLAFDYVGSGLIVGKKDGVKPTEEDKTGKLARFAIAGEDKKWVWADAVIDGQTVVVSSPEVPAPVAVRYAFSQNPAGLNLYNKEGLPASPFRTDDW